MKKMILLITLILNINTWAKDCSLSLYMPVLDQRGEEIQKEVFDTLARKNYQPVEQVSIRSDLKTTYLLNFSSSGVIRFGEKVEMNLYEVHNNQYTPRYERVKRTFGGDMFEGFMDLLKYLPSCVVY
jgi:hypothetical protein